MENSNRAPRQAASQSAPPAEKPKKKRGRIALFIVGALLTVTLSVGGGVLGASVMQNDSDEDSGFNLIETVTGLFAKELVAQTIELEPFLTNLKEEKGTRPQVIRLTVNMQVTGEDNLMKVETQEAAIRDRVLARLGQHTRSSIYEVTDKKELVLKEALLKDVNALFETNPVDTLFLTDLLIQ